jgi:hypothetical protein
MSCFFIRALAEYESLQHLVVATEESLRDLDL